MQSGDNTLDKMIADFTVNDMPVREALELLLSQSGFRYKVYDVPSDKKITLTSKNVSLLGLLSLISRTANVGWEWRLIHNSAEYASANLLCVDKDILPASRSQNPIVYVGKGLIRQTDLQNYQARKKAKEDAEDILDKQLVSVNFADQPVSDSLTQVLKMSSLPNKVTATVPNTKLTLNVSDAPLSGLLDVLTRTAGVSWKMQAEDSGEKPTAVLLVEPRNGLMEMRTATAQIEGLAIIQKIYGDAFSKANKAFSNSNKLLGAGSYTNGNALLYRWNTLERRATFTCPTNGQKITVLLPPDTKPTCPTCKRTYGSEFAFCPKDGTKLAAPKPQWNYCPVCGKKMDARHTLSTMPTGTTLFRSFTPAIRPAEK